MKKKVKTITKGKLARKMRRTFNSMQKYDFMANWTGLVNHVKK